MPKKSRGNKEPVTVLTLPLHVRPWEADVLDTRFRICGSIYNAMLGMMLNAYNELCQDPEYAEAKKLLDAVLKHDDSSEARKKAKEIRQSPEYKEALALTIERNKAAGLYEYSFVSVVNAFRDHFKDIIPSNLAALSIAKPMWAAFNKLLYGDGKQCKFKKSRDFSSMATNGKSGIRIVDESNNTVSRIEADPNKKYSLLFSTKKGKQLCLPIVIDRKDDYVIDSLGRDIKIVRVLRKRIREKYQYCLQITVAGTPAVKYDHDGNLVHPIGKGRIAVFLDESYFTVADEAGNITEIDLDNPERYTDKIQELQTKMDESKRISNPQNINPDGTFKNRKNCPGEKLTWHFSKTYRHYSAQKADLERRERESREIRSNRIASRILAMGDDISVNDRSFKTNVGKRGYHDKIRRNSPAQIVTALEKKLVAAGLGGLNKYTLKVEAEDKGKAGYRAKYAKKLLVERLKSLGEA